MPEQQRKTRKIKACPACRRRKIRCDCNESETSRWICAYYHRDTQSQTHGQKKHSSAPPDSTSAIVNSITKRPPLLPQPPALPVGFEFENYTTLTEVTRVPIWIRRNLSDTYQVAASSGRIVQLALRALCLLAVSRLSEAPHYLPQARSTYAKTLCMLQGQINKGDLDIQTALVCRISSSYEVLEHNEGRSGWCDHINGLAQVVAAGKHQKVEDLLFLAAHVNASSQAGLTNLVSDNIYTSLPTQIMPTIYRLTTKCAPSRRVDDGIRPSDHFHAQTLTNMSGPSLDNGALANSRFDFGILTIGFRRGLHDFHKPHWKPSVSSPYYLSELLSYYALSLSPMLEQSDAILDSDQLKNSVVKSEWLETMSHLAELDADLIGWYHDYKVEMDFWDDEATDPLSCDSHIDTCRNAVTLMLYWALRLTINMTITDVCQELKTALANQFQAQELSDDHGEDEALVSKLLSAHPSVKTPLSSMKNAN
ncbi:MAG: hypothetical protein Q9159_003053 [Coniocarpon cinnabarinum]